MGTPEPPPGTPAIEAVGITKRFRAASAFWVIFFQEVASVRGWDVDRVLLLLAVLRTSAGLVPGLLSNSRRIPTLVADGSLDEVLTLPVAPLPHLLVRRWDNFDDQLTYHHEGEHRIAWPALRPVGVSRSC